MKLVVLFLILSLKYTLGCDTFDTTRTCECSAWYTIGNNSTETKLFNVTGYQDCGPDLGCEFYRYCTEFCILRVRIMLGGDSSNLGITGMNRICSMLALPNQNIAGSGIKITTQWKYDTCASGTEQVINDVCCNKKCNCKLVGQQVTPFGDYKNEQIIDLSALIPNPNIAYYCSLSEIDDCQENCLDQTSRYFGDDNLKNPNFDKLNWNIFSDSKNAIKICQDINRKIGRPGMDIYTQIDSELGSKRNYNLGRVCCNNNCKCDYKFYFAEDGKEFANQVPVTISSNLTIGYECSDELSDCMAHCRRNAIASVTALDPDYEEYKPLHLNDFFKFKFDGTGDYGFTICRLMNKNSIPPGVNVYLRYSVDGSSKAPFVEELHLGRICCTPFSSSNRCFITP